MKEITKESMIAAAKRAASEIDGPLSRSDFERPTGISQYHIYRLFPEGNWSEVKKKADLERHPIDRRSFSDEELLEELNRVASELGKMPSWLLFSTRANISADVVRRRFGGHTGTLKRYRTWLMKNNPESELLKELETRESRTSIQIPSTEEPSPLVISQWDRTPGTQFGPPIDFRGRLVCLSKAFQKGPRVKTSCHRPPDGYQDSLSQQQPTA